MKKTILILLLLVGCSPVPRIEEEVLKEKPRERWALIANGGGYNYRGNSVSFSLFAGDMYNAFLDAGIPEDHIYAYAGWRTNAKGHYRDEPNGRYADCHYRKLDGRSITLEKGPVGRDFDGDGNADCGAVSWGNVRNGISELAGRMESGDDLFIAIAGHGLRRDGNEWIVSLWKGVVSGNSWEKELDRLPPGRRAVFLWSCFSDIFRDRLLDGNTVVLWAGYEPRLWTGIWTGGGSRAYDLDPDPNWVLHELFWPIRVKVGLGGEADGDNDSFVTWQELADYVGHRDGANVFGDPELIEEWGLRVPEENRR